jgi:hypothetical protein
MFLASFVGHASDICPFSLSLGLPLRSSLITSRFAVLCNQGFGSSRVIALVFVVLVLGGS